MATVSRWWWNSDHKDTKTDGVYHDTWLDYPPQLALLSLSPLKRPPFVRRGWWVAGEPEVRATLVYAMSALWRFTAREANKVLIHHDYAIWSSHFGLFVVRYLISLQYPSDCIELCAAIRPPLIKEASPGLRVFDVWKPGRWCS